MTETLRRISGMPLVLPERDIYSRLGYSRHRTELDDASRARLDGEIRKAFALCRPRGIWRIIPVVAYDEHSVTLADGSCFVSDDIAARYGQCRAFWLAAATVGSELPAAVRRNFAEGNNMAALAGDATGSETADAAIDFMQKRSDQELRKLGSGLTERRFSPGYGDLPLAAQKTFFAALEIEKELGVVLTPSLIMEPEKSVTALAGVL